MGRNKRERRIARVSKSLDEGEFEHPPVEPVSDLARSAWIAGTCMAWLISVMAIGSSVQLSLGIAPFLAVCLGSALFERRRGRLRLARGWMIAGGVWIVSLAWLPGHLLISLRDFLL